jgi:hypothetical protein
MFEETPHKMAEERVAASGRDVNLITGSFTLERTDLGGSK